MPRSATSSPVDDEDTGNDNSVFLFVSLYLVLLAFFILLVAISTVAEQKVEEAVESVENTFSQPKDDTNIQMVEQSRPVGSNMATASYFAPLKDLIKQRLELTDEEITETGNRLMVQMAASKLFLPGSAKMVDEDGFMQVLAETVSRQYVNERMDVEFVIGESQAARYKPLTAEANLSLARAGMFARILSQHGVAPQAILSGVTASDPEVVTLIFFSRQAQEADVRF